VSRFGYETIERGAVVIITLRGELDLRAGAELEPELARLTDCDHDVLALDLRELEFLDSSGLSMIVQVAQVLDDAGRRLVLVRGPQSVQRMFEITRMTERLEFVDAPEHVRA
jgi:anti-sigma B factor antagonist